MQRKQLNTGRASRLQANAVNGIGKTPTSWLCRFLALMVACTSLSAFADSASPPPVPDYLQPMVAMAHDTSWISPTAPVDNGKTPYTADRPLNVLVDGVKEIDVVADPVAWQELSKLILIEIGVPMANRRYVFTSMQSLHDFMAAADMVMVQSMVEDEYAKVHPQNAKSANALMETGSSSDDEADEATSREDNAFHGNGIASRSMSAAASMHDSAAAYVAKPPMSSPKYRTAAGWETDESVWIMNYHYIPGCGNAVVWWGPCTPVDGLGAHCRGDNDTYASRTADWRFICWFGDKQFWGGYDDSSVVTSHGGEQEHVQMHYATVNGPIYDRNICETYGWWFGTTCTSWWSHGPRAIIMGRFADMILAKSQGNRTPEPSTWQSNPYFSSPAPGTRVLIKSPQFWSFCSFFPNCRFAFQLPEPSSLGYTLLPWQGFSLIPDARNTYFYITAGVEDYNEINYIEVTTYRERTSDPVLGQVATAPSGLFQGEEMAALMEASSGCDSVIMPPRYTDTELTPAHTFDRGEYCVVPRRDDGSALLHVRDRSSEGVLTSVFFADQTCFNNAPPIVPDPAAWEAACYRSRNACSLIDLANRARYDITGVSDLNHHFDQCVRLFQGQRSIPGT